MRGYVERNVIDSSGSVLPAVLFGNFGFIVIERVSFEVRN
jgi:hypothetical protein